ncbi:MAG: hypothetical protein GKS00_06480 [Alphaproteobacteria bacterium]|nr:hypothetical protein [Alphaproteobacteria bacterium]
MAEDTQSARGFLRPRPIRVAYLVEDGEHADVLLDALFAECNTRWGGRYSLIIPCEQGKPCPAYLPWLEIYDPDIIYAYIDLDEAAVAELHERFGPSYVIKHEPHDDGERDARYFRPEIPIECLSSLSVAPYYARSFPASAPQPMLVVDYLPPQPSDRFVDDNFGTPYLGFGSWPLPEQMSDSIKALSLASADVLEAHLRGRLEEGVSVRDTVSLLYFMAEHRNSFGLSQLAADLVPRIEIRERFNNTFSLIIGDCFADRVLFWNQRNFVPPHLGRDFTTLIVSPSRLEDAKFFSALVAFLKARCGIFRANSSTPWIALNSTSLKAEELIALRDSFNHTDTWNTYRLDGPTSLDGAVPNTKALSEVGGLVTGKMFDRSTEWKEFSVKDTSIRPPVARPVHIQELQGASRAGVGAWALDLDIARQNNLTRFANIQHMWRFPRRLRMHGAFRGTYDGPANSMPRSMRSSREGLLVLFHGIGENMPTITLPDDDTAFREALARGRDWPPASRMDQGDPPSGAYCWSRPSDKGRYLIGTLRLFGGLQEAGTFLLHSYWKHIFNELGAAVGGARHENIKRTLKDRLRQSEIDSEDDWDRLTRVVANEAHRARIPLRTLTFDDLKKRHGPFMEAERKALEEREDSDEWIAHAKESLPQSVQSLCAQSILYQGYEWRCRTCYHLNWNPIGSLKPQTMCEVCGTSQIASVDKSWDFRLNEFLLEALKEHGLLALVWALNRFERRAKETFFFLGPHDLFVEYPRGDSVLPDNEADLICVVDTKVHLCEVKSSRRGIQISALINVAKRIRPDFVTLAVMEPDSRRLTATFSRLKEALIGTGIEAELMTLSDDAFDDGAHLPR